MFVGQTRAAFPSEIVKGGAGKKAKVAAAADECERGGAGVQKALLSKATKPTVKSEETSKCLVEPTTAKDKDVQFLLR